MSLRWRVVSDKKLRVSGDSHRIDLRWQHCQGIFAVSRIKGKKRTLISPAFMFVAHTGFCAEENAPTWRRSSSQL